MREDRRHTTKDCWGAAPPPPPLLLQRGRPNAGHGRERRPSSSLLFLLLLCLKVISYLPVVERVAFPPPSPVRYRRGGSVVAERGVFLPFPSLFSTYFQVRDFGLKNTYRICVVDALVRRTAQVDHVWHSVPDPNRNFGSFSPQNRLRKKIAVIGSGSRDRGNQRSR